MKAKEPKSLASLAKRQYNDSCYRRGYHHGYCQAIDDIKDKYTWTQMADFFDHELVFWRYRTNIDEMIIPPIIQVTWRKKVSETKT